MEIEPGAASGKVNFIPDNLISKKKAVPMVVVMSNGMVETLDGNEKELLTSDFLKSSF
ncbi:MAG: hypothetical protein V8S42_04285 [Lachnospiraceae bacterium]